MADPKSGTEYDMITGATSDAFDHTTFGMAGHIMNDKATAVKSVGFSGLNRMVRRLSIIGRSKV